MSEGGLPVRARDARPAKKLSLADSMESKFWLPVRPRAGNLQGSRYLLGQSFCACFVLKLAAQRVEGAEREEVQFSKQIPQDHLDPRVWGGAIQRVESGDLS